MKHAEPKKLNLNFDNPQTSFAHLSNQELLRAAWLFQAMGVPELVKIGPAAVSWGLKAGLPLSPLLKPTIFKQFCGGETLEQCEPLMKKLWQHQIFSILDFAVEGEEDEANFNRTAAELEKNIAFTSKHEATPFSVFKVTGLAPFALLEKISAGETLNDAEKTAEKHLRARVEKLCAKADELNVRILVDAEESWIQPAIDHIVHDMMKRFNKKRPIVFNTLQCYLKDRPAYLHKLLQFCQQHHVVAGVKLVRGAYLEKERLRAKERGTTDPTMPTKEATDVAFNETCATILANLEHVHVCIGTHNEHSCHAAAEKMLRLKIERHDPRVYMSQLLGMGDHISFNLAREGFRVAKYVPYGPLKKTLPYLFRRAQENTSVGGQTPRELKLLKKELQRRKLTMLDVLMVR